MGEMSTPLVSILLAAYNVGPYLERCVRSLQCQTYPNIEIIIVDDCSPDECGEQADRFAREDSRIHVVHHSFNTGLSGARNTGIEHSKGQFITFVDGDDWVEPDYVAYLMDIQMRTNSDIVMCRNFFTSRLHEQIKEDAITAITSDDMLCDILYNRIHEGVWNKLYRRSLIDGLRFRSDCLTGEGMQFNCQVVPRAQTVGVGLKRVYTYNVDNENSATKKPDIRKQAYGAMATVDIMRDETLATANERVQTAMQYQYFTTALYALSHIVRAKAVASNVDFYRYLIRIIRELAPQTLLMEISNKQRLKSLLAWLSPLFTVEIAIMWRVRLGHRQRV